MTIGSSTTQIHMINLAVTAADGSGQVWQDDVQMIPLGMNGNPEGFVTAIKAGLPLVNHLRILFNEFSFTPDGSMHPQFERFLAAAASAGYQITLTYGSGDNQQTGIGDTNHPSLSNAQSYAALQDNFSDVSAAWTRMMDWANDHPTTAAAIYGWDLMNEAASYRHSIRANGADALTPADFVRLYATHCAALADLITARAEGKILVGGWGYNGDFATLATTTLDGASVLDHLRAAIGGNLVWSAHLYPGWMGTTLLSDPTALAARLDEVYAALTGDDVLITETNIDGAADDQSQDADFRDVFAANFEWFAENGIGIGWYPGVQTGASHLIYVDADGSVNIRHQHALAHGLNAFSLGVEPGQQAGHQRIAVTQTNAGLRNEDYEIATGKPLYDPLTILGTAFGYAGADTVQGSAQSNDFLYGGSGDDVLRAAGGDDFLFGQGDDDRLVGGPGFDHLFGGDGQDTLDAGTGANQMAGGAGNDSYTVRSPHDMVKEFAFGGTDTVTTTLRLLSLLTGNPTQYAHIENLIHTGSGNFRGIGNALANVLTGADGADTLRGGAGRDTLSGRDGDDRLFGGADGDRFVFARGTGRDEVMDFTHADQIVLQNLPDIATVAEALAHATQVGDDVVFDFGTHSLVLRGTQLDTLAQDLTIT
jgi:Ca2+-binding RTX toxin-like protein